jgi:hypothetical protein
VALSQLPQGSWESSSTDIADSVSTPPDNFAIPHDCTVVTLLASCCWLTGYIIQYAEAPQALLFLWIPQALFLTDDLSCLDSHGILNSYGARWKWPWWFLGSASQQPVKEIIRIDWGRSNQSGVFLLDRYTLLCHALLTEREDVKQRNKLLCDLRVNRS